MAAEGTTLMERLDLLTRWSSEILGDPAFDGVFPPDVVQSGWLGYAPASEEQIRHAGSRLGVALPPTYRTFLQVSNGRQNTSPFIYRVLGVYEMDWLRNRHPEISDAWKLGRQIATRTNGPLSPLTDEEYLVYGDKQLPSRIRDEYLDTAMEISDVGDGARYVLNPQVVTRE